MVDVGARSRPLTYLTLLALVSSRSGGGRVSSAIFPRCVEFPDRPLTLKGLEHAFVHADYRTVRIQIINEEILVVGRPENIACNKAPWVMIQRYMAMLETLRDFAPLPDIDFLMSTSDSSPPFPVLGLNNPVDRPRFEHTYMAPTHIGLGGIRPPHGTYRADCKSLKVTEDDRRKWANKKDTLVDLAEYNVPGVDRRERHETRWE